MLDNNEEEYKEMNEEANENPTEEIKDDSNPNLSEEGEVSTDLVEESENEIVEESENEIVEEFDEDGQPIEDEGLPFAKAEVVRLMKKNLDKDKMIRERVKVEMNKFLGEVLERVCEQLNDYPYTTIEYEMLKESIYPYTNIKRINEEKFRILKHLEAIKADCDALTMDVKKSLKLKDVDDDSDEIF
jgi:histone H3/H4